MSLANQSEFVATNQISLKTFFDGNRKKEKVPMVNFLKKRVQQSTWELKNNHFLYKNRLSGLVKSVRFARPRKPWFTQKKIQLPSSWLWRQFESPGRVEHVFFKVFIEF